MYNKTYLRVTKKTPCNENRKTAFPANQNTKGYIYPDYQNRLPKGAGAIGPGPAIPIR